MSLFKRREPVAEGAGQPAADWWPRADEGQLSLDVFREGETLVIRAPMAGVRDEDLHLSVDGDLLTIRGERRQDREVNEDDWFMRECYWGSFSRSVVLPNDVDGNRASASLNHGLLEVRLPIYASGKRIEIKTGA